MAEAQQRFISIGELTLHVQDWQREATQTLVFLHGLASTSHMFDLVAPALALKYHVMAVDQRGHGLSDKPDSGYDFETIASDLDKLLAATGHGDEKISLAGHSWGGSTALYYAATRPNRVASIILIDGGIRNFQDRFARWEDAELGMAPPRHENLYADTLREWIRERWQPLSEYAAVEDLVLSLFDLNDPTRVKPRLRFENHMQIAYHLWAFQPAEYYARIRCPVLIVNAVAPNSEIDTQMQGYADEAQRQIGQAEVVWMRDTVHDIPWHRPETLVEVIERFLDTPR